MRTVGIDVGGTFTDLVALDPDGTVATRKVLSTPGDQSEGVAEAIRALGAGAIQRVVHGTTVATNALLERTGARVVLCATEGFTDLLELRRQDRASLYDLSAHHPPALVSHGDAVAVPERTGPDGVLRSLRRGDASDVAAAVALRAPGAVAVSLLHSYAHPAHEQALSAAVRAELPHVEVVLSSETYPEIREYERTATTVAEAYLRPTVRQYLERLTARLAALGAPAPSVMSSSGGMRPASEAGRHAAALALSGPAGGVVGAAAVLRELGLERALTVDIGGTSADVGLILDGAPLVESGGAVAGVPIALPRVLVETVSAGGGSLLWVDDGGALRVGPRSAGAVPGPAAFGRGGVDATITDAHVLLGNVAPRPMSGGVSVDASRAAAAMAAVASRLGAPAERVARAAIAIADATMARALRRVSVERGVDPRDCVLVAFGGGGPLHACGLAEILGMTRVLVPPHAGVLSALGLAIAPERREAIGSVMQDTRSLDAESFGIMLETLAAPLAFEGGRERQWWLRTRYAGQGHELEVAASPGTTGERIAEAFAAMHQARYGFTLDRAVEIVSARAAVSGKAHPLHLGRGDAERVEAVRGPATLPLADATLLVAGGWVANPLPIGGWMLEREPR